MHGPDISFILISGVVKRGPWLDKNLRFILCHRGHGRYAPNGTRYRTFDDLIVTANWPGACEWAEEVQLSRWDHVMVEGRLLLRAFEREIECPDTGRLMLERRDELRILSSSCQRLNPPPYKLIQKLAEEGWKNEKAGESEDPREYIQRPADHPDPLL